MPALCRQCNNSRQFANKALRHHMKCPNVFHPRCSTCSPRCVIETAFEAHMSVIHPPIYDCMVCVMTSQTPFSMKDHYYGSPAHPKYDRCGRGFKDDCACEQHYRISHPSTHCFLCGGKAFYEYALDHCVPENYPSCNLCDIESKDDNAYAELLSAVDAKLRCGICCSYIETTNIQAHFKSPAVHPKCGQRRSKTRNAYREDTHNPISPLSTTQKDHIKMDKQYDDPGSTSSSTSSNMFSSNSQFVGGSYYNVRGDVRFSPSPSQISPGLTILHQNISASACHNSRERYPPPRCHSSTRKEILEIIINHITETRSSFKVLHLLGSEGTGKSAIAQTIAEYSKSSGTLGACFFFCRASSERNTDKNLIATLAYQLCVNIPGLKRFIVKAVEEDLSTFQKDVDTQIEKLIINPIVEANDKGVVHKYPILIVIDGIDECEGKKEQHAFLRAVSSAMGGHQLPLFFVITSRPEMHIVSWLNHDPIICSTSHPFYIDRSITHTKRDIEIYIRSEFERIRSAHQMPESFVWPSQASIQTLVSNTNILFRCASKIMAFIDDPMDTPQNRLEDILRTSTQSSDDHS